MVLSDQSAAIPCPRDESHLWNPSNRFTALVLRSLFSHHVKYSIQYSQNYIHFLSCVFFSVSSLEGGGDGPNERLTFVAGVSIV